MSQQTVMVRNFLHELRGTGGLHKCHSKHSPTSRLLWRRHRQWDFSILSTRFFLSPFPCSLEQLREGFVGIPLKWLLEKPKIWAEGLCLHLRIVIGIHPASLPWSSVGHMSLSAEQAHGAKQLSCNNFHYTRKPQVYSLESFPRWQN